MARNKGNLVDCLGSICHHVEPCKAFLMVAAGCNTLEGITHRFAMVKTEAIQVTSQIRKIQELAASKGYTDITSLLEEEFEYGCD